MLIGGIAFGLVLGLVIGGRLERLADIRLRFLPLLFLAVIVRFATETLLGFGLDLWDALRVLLLGGAYGLLLFTLWHNRTYPGLALAFVGIASNTLVIVANGGRMPVWQPAFDASGLAGPLNSVLHVMVDGTGPDFLLRLGPLGDVIPIPIWPVQNVASLGDFPQFEQEFAKSHQRRRRPGRELLLFQHPLHRFEGRQSLRIFQ